MTGLSLALAGTVVPNKKKLKLMKPTINNNNEDKKKLFSSHHHNNNKGGDMVLRKKLRLTKEQSAMLEHSFNQHTILNSAQKKSLAEQLNLKTRQIEVWFQNRRARTKLKQTEVEYELLKKRCQSLTDENRRLKKELQELTAIKTSPTTTTTVAMCSSCHNKLLHPN
ncbi:Homeobox-leucine zipper protein hat22 [Stylosanthes scabra]|uniref:Homeobox-leucine zipper protein hat22 n=1 Tax=Stylosanthes scabra TaxID=79078 RepID=A0ABU6Z5B8_9FABA|nr:Homeobox-leucine zipper protein hat22 [Stylosanthes scabra]